MEVAPTRGRGIQPILPEWIEIPEGPFLMGSRAEVDPLSFMDEKPQHRALTSAFMMAKHPVTNREYQAFLDDLTPVAIAGYRSENHVPLHWNGISLPGGKDDHPVVNVSRKSAVQYCGWLSSKTGLQIQLPTETQWEKAARGEDGRIFPWGNKWIAGNCNSAESGLRDTSPVGSFPTGRSPYGVEDMAGNIWEWCDSTYLPKNYGRQSDEDAAPSRLVGPEYSLRGGSFFDLQQDVRCARRAHLRWEYRGWYYGFRVACILEDPTAWHSQ